MKSPPTVERAHPMPFSARVDSNGGVTFRLWAPAPKRIDLWLEDPSGGERAHAMEPAGDGWFERHEPDAGPGTRYRFRLEDGTSFPDPASRHQPDDVHGPSEVVDPRAYSWGDPAWQGRAWNEAVIYELHVGTFTREGTFAAARERLGHLARAGVTAIELMPLSDFPGRQNWGYDGVLPFAPDSAYGPPGELKSLVDAAHREGLMVLLDVVYNHFGPEGNYLHVYAPAFFTKRHRTPWGAAINFDGEGSRTVRDFFIHNALYWLEEFHFDGLRLDAVHAIHDEARPSFLEDLAVAVREGPGASRHVHLVLENDDNDAKWMAREPSGRPGAYVAQWNDDLHHALHCLLTGESGGYYGDYAGAPARHLGRCLAEGFAYQGESSAHRDGAARGSVSRHLPPVCFVNFLQNHDQVGNRGFGDRLVTLADPAPLRAAVAILLLAPSPPLLFMGEEFGCRQPFPFFCDFGPELARAVTEGRRREFARFPEFEDPAAREKIPDPNAAETFDSAVLDWSALETDEGRRWLEHYRHLLDLRRREIVPLLQGAPPGTGRFDLDGEGLLSVSWSLAGGTRLELLAHLGERARTGVTRPSGDLLHDSGNGARGRGGLDLEPWSVLWFLDRAGR